MNNSTESMDNFKYIIKNLSDQGIIHNNKQSKARDITPADTSGHIESADNSFKSSDNLSNDIGPLKSEYLGKSSSNYFTDHLADSVKPSSGDNNCGCHDNNLSYDSVSKDSISVDDCHTCHSKNSDAISISSRSISSNNDKKTSICDNCCHDNSHTEEIGCSHRLNKGSTDNLTNDKKTSNICDKCALSDENHDHMNVKKMCDIGEKCTFRDEKLDHTNVKKPSYENCSLSDNKETCDSSAPCHDVPSILMIGLHCCGDLTPTMMKFFSSLDDIKGLCCVSCCYHRMKYDGMYLKYVL